MACHVVPHGISTARRRRVHGSARRASRPASRSASSRSRAAPPPIISRIEVGRADPSYQILRVLAETLGVSADFLAIGERPRSRAAGPAARSRGCAPIPATPAGARDLYEAAKSDGRRAARGARGAGPGASRSTRGDQTGAVGHLEARSTRAPVAGRRDRRHAATARPRLRTPRPFRETRRRARCGRFAGRGDRRRAAPYSLLGAAREHADRLRRLTARRGLLGDPRRGPGLERPGRGVASLLVAVAAARLAERRDLAAHYARLAHAALEATEHTSSPRARSSSSPTSRTTAATTRGARAGRRVPRRDRRGGNQLEEGMLLLERARALSDARRDARRPRASCSAQCEVRRRPPDQPGSGLRDRCGISASLGES